METTTGTTLFGAPAPNHRSAKLAFGPGDGREIPRKSNRTIAVNARHGFESQVIEEAFAVASGTVAGSPSHHHSLQDRRVTTGSGFVLLE
jgi:hypothetical protein